MNDDRQYRGLAFPLFVVIGVGVVIALSMGIGFFAGVSYGRGHTAYCQATQEVYELGGAQ